MVDIKEKFKDWCINKPDDLGEKSKPSTVLEYINRLNRLSQRLYEDNHWENLINDIYTLKLLFMNNRNWQYIEEDDLYKVVTYLYQYKKKNRNFNDRYNHFFHNLRKQLDLPLSTSSKRPDFFLDILKNTEEYANLSDWIRHVFITDKSINYLSWLYINKAEKRRVYVALSMFSNFLVQTNSVSKELCFALCQKELWEKRKDKFTGDLKIIEASGIESRNFYSIYEEGKVEKLLSIKDVAFAMGCAETNVYRLLEKKKLNFKPGTNKIIAENVRRFLRRRHTKRSVGQITDDDKTKDRKNWVKMKEAKKISDRSATYIRKKVKEGRVAYTRYGLRKFLYFKPDLMKI